LGRIVPLIGRASNVGREGNDGFRRISAPFA
jgi:hypothetical protein